MVPKKPRSRRAICRRYELNSNWDGAKAFLRRFSGPYLPFSGCLEARVPSECLPLRGPSGTCSIFLFLVDELRISHFYRSSTSRGAGSVEKPWREVPIVPRYPRGIPFLPGCFKHHGNCPPAALIANIYTMNQSWALPPPFSFLVVKPY